MKQIRIKAFYLLAGLFLLSQAHAQTLISYGTSKVSKDEFWRAYNKNKQLVTDKEKSLREYLDLYSNFKLKVKAAQELRLDTAQQLKYDVDNFRNQIMDNYLSDEKGFSRLQQEAFDRSQKDVHVIHYSLPATGTDSLKTAVEIKELFQLLLSGKNSDDAVASLSSRVVPIKKNDIGYITAFTLPYEYENLIYGLKAGGISEPYRSKTSWHIFTVVDEKPAAGKWKIAQILFTFPPDATAAIKESLRMKADSVYGLLQKGMPFGAAVKEYSDDKITYLTEGELPEFTTGKFTYAFESEVFKLNKDGEISRPFASTFGYHIVKRISQSPVVSNRKDETYQFELKQKILGDARINIEREKFAKEIVARTGFKSNGTVKEFDLLRYADTLMTDFSEASTKNSLISKKIIASFSDKTLVYGSDWLKFVRDYKANFEQYKGETNKELWDKFVVYSSVEFYKKNLEKYNDDFKFQMQEFREGNMLFEVMEKNVWDKAASDATALLKYYAENKTKYTWNKSADVIVFNCSSEQVAQEVLKKLSSGSEWKKLTEESNATIQSDSGRYELSQVPGVESIQQPAPGGFSPIMKNTDGSASFVKLIHFYPHGMLRSFDEARGMVINDYQNVLEKKWLATLKIKYPVRINETVFKSMLQ